MNNLLCNFVKILLFVNVFLFTKGVLLGQPPAWHWAKAAGTGDEDAGRSCVTDANGNVIVTGYFEFSTINFGTVALANSGGYDMFLVKYDSLGNVLWAKSAIGTSNDEGISCSVDLNGDIIVTGFYGGATITFDTIVLTNTIPWTSDIFMAKYSSNGDVVWAKSVGGSDHDFVNYCSTDTFGNIYVTGRFDSDTLTIGSSVLINSGASDIYISKFDNSGNAIWAKSAGGASFQDALCCTTDNNGNVIISGYFYGPTLDCGATILTNSGPSITPDMFIVKYDSSGNVLWAKSAGGISYEFGSSCATDAVGNIIVTGTFSSNNITFGTTVLSNTGFSDVYIVKLDPQGNELWAKSEGGTGGDEAMSCTTDLYGNIFVTGNFNSPTITVGTTVLYHANDLDIFIIKYDSIGNFIWANSVGDIFDEYVWNCTTDLYGNLIITGLFQSYSLNVGPIVLFNLDGSDMFVAKLDTDLNQVGLNNGIFEDRNVFLYPNPATDVLKIHCSKCNFQSIEIYNMHGEIIGNSTQPNIDLSLLNSGVYFVRLIGKNESFMEKLIVE